MTNRTTKNGSGLNMPHLQGFVGWRRAELCGLDASQPLKRGDSPCAGSRIAPRSWLATSQRLSTSVKIPRLAAHGMQCPLDALGIARDDGEVGFGWLVGLRAALFPIPKSAQRNVVAHGKLFLGQREGAAKRFDTRNAAQSPGQRIGWLAQTPN